MKASVKFVVCIFLFSISLAHGGDTVSLEAREIAKRASEVDKYRSWSASIEVTQRSANGNTSSKSGITKMKLGEDGRPMRLFLFSSPGDIAGTTLLNIEKPGYEDNMWLYLPAIGRTRQIASGNKKNSFVGTEFTFSDLATPKTDLYDHRIVDEVVRQEADHYVVLSTAKNQDVVEDYGYQKVKSWIRKDNFTTTKILYFDEEGKKFKRQNIRDFVKLDNEGHWLARHRVMENLTSQDKTLFVLDDVKTDIKNDHQFNPNRLGM
ncbi:MAG: outer membrane lipoprotein-sorting protein [Oleiphilaceae bacterium]|nr:outer membrane lipoprotein-sorting protein [Oleiphilaceae bacterium]